MWVVLFLTVFGHLSDAVVIPIPQHTLPLQPVLPVHHSTVLNHGLTALTPRRNIINGALGGTVAGIFDRILGNPDVHINDHLLEEHIDGIHADREGLEHGHVGDNCQHRNFGCDVPGYHCVQTSERSYSPCSDGQAAHCHCKRGCLHKGFFIQHGYRRIFRADCQKCRCIYGEVTCRYMRGRRCRRNRRRYWN